MYVPQIARPWKCLLVLLWGMFWMRRWKKGEDKCCDDCKDLKSWYCGISVIFVPMQGSALQLCSHHPAKLILSCIQKTFRSDNLPLLEMGKTWPLPAAVEVRRRIWVSLVFTSHSPFFSVVEFSMSCSHVLCNCCFSFKFSLASS